MIYSTYYSMVYEISKFWRFSGFRHFYILKSDIFVWYFRVVKVATFRIFKILEIFEISEFYVLNMYILYSIYTIVVFIAYKAKALC